MFTRILSRQLNVNPGKSIKVARSPVHKNVQHSGNFGMPRNQIQDSKRNASEGNQDELCLPSEKMHCRICSVYLTQMEAIGHFRGAMHHFQVLRKRLEREGVACPPPTHHKLMSESVWCGPCKRPVYLGLRGASETWSQHMRTPQHIAAAMNFKASPCHPQALKERSKPNARVRAARKARQVTAQIREI